MQIGALTPDEAILTELGLRLERVRKRQGLSQASLAQAAGIGVATLRRIEDGRDAQLGSWIKVLMALNMEASIESLLPGSFDSPMQDAIAAGIAHRRPPRRGTDDAPFRWGDEQR